MIAFIKQHKVAVGVVAVLAVLGGVAYARSRRAATTRGTLLDPYPGVTPTPWDQLGSWLKGSVQILSAERVDDNGNVIDSSGSRPPVTFEEMQ